MADILDLQKNSPLEGGLPEGINPEYLEAASSFALQTDQTFWIIFGVSLICFIGIVGFMIMCCVKYSRKNNKHPKQIHGSVVLETVWTVIPTIIVLLMFWNSWVGYKKIVDVPPGAYEINVIGKKWDWTFKYPEGFSYNAVTKIVRDANEKLVENSSSMVVPINTPIKIILNSDDVVHSFSVPSFRVKADAMPKPKIDKLNYVWFEATKLGKYDLQCTEFCGKGHSQMNSSVKVVSKAEFAKWNKAKLKEKQSIEANLPGLLVYREKCASCHTNDGSAGTGPTFKGFLNRDRKVLTVNGDVLTGVKADLEYTTESIRNPAAKIVEGYGNLMTPQKVTDQNILDLIKYFEYIDKN